MSKRTVFSIGHSTHSFEAFASLLRSVAISAIADVRSIPWSRHQPHFNRPELKESLDQIEIDYRYFGKTLGGRPDKAELFNNLTADYDAMARTDLFRKGIDHIVSGSERHNLAMMCSEHDPLDCHRCLLIGRALLQQDIVVNHILANGDICSQTELEERLLKLNGNHSDDLYVSREELVNMAYRNRSMKVAYKERPTTSEEAYDFSDV